MKVADMLNPTAIGQLTSPPLSPQQQQRKEDHYDRQPIIKTKRNNSTSTSINNNGGKPRSRFSDIEDSIICEGVARGLTWGQISSQLPHRKRATCFNRYRTLQGIRKSRNNSSTSTDKQITAIKNLPPPGTNMKSHNNNIMMLSPPITPPNSSAWLPSSPPSSSIRLSEDNVHRRSSLHLSHRHPNSYLHRHQLPALVAPLPTRLPLPYSYARP
ncbi:uncharacterized protein BX663DRAFT_480375 [Cokeromyces recurvatus]|uniref:uncharacterized protein n=1 Tax=Cokeromyces recurvatus TaxID=90255 RepID=UPI0022203013|nr:uncharacterized protein BX663DRAFT_480375 [Cokeromyces recurvatus]KAI7898339.1 hypothetical protein BX663DRAFT_480375 [Cokeromyces recurvatus]